MNKKQLWLLLLTLCCVSAAATPAKADFIFNGPDGAPNVGDTILFKLQNYEVVLDQSKITWSQGTMPTTSQITSAIKSGGVAAVGDELFGIVKITQIVSKDGSKIYWNSGGNQGLEGAFWGYRATSVPSGGTGDYLFNGGKFAIYFDSTPDFTAATGPFTSGWSGIASANGVGNAGDSLFLTADGVNGIVPSDTSTTLKSTFSALDTSLTPPSLTGVGDAFLKSTFSSTFIIPPDSLDPTHAVSGQQDLRYKSNFQSYTDDVVPVPFQDTGWTIHSQDPVTFAYNGLVPVPSSLTLLGTGVVPLLGLFWMRGKKLLARGKSGRASA